MHSSTGSIFILIMTLATMVITAAPIQLNKSGDKAYGIVKSNEMIMYYVYTDTSFTLSLNYVDSVTVYIRSGYEPTRIMYDYIITSAYPSQDVLVYSNSTYFIGVSTTATQKSYTIELKKSNSNSQSTESGLANWIIAVIATIVSVVVLCIVGITFLIIGLICCGVFGCGLVCCGIGGAAAMHANSTQQPASSTTTVTTTYGGVNGQPMQPQQQLYYQPQPQPQKPPYSDIPMQPMAIPVAAQPNPISSMHSMNSWEGSQISLNSGFSSQAQLYENLQPTCPVIEEEEEEPKELVMN
ncbi:predicted protein [Naegleria gruberi]|uniref:Predicted protein n=1 Tax=Naegleria gruberi TaxID=5762 RepID=D2VD93_NAEGR|nr:uncharacterized protein NAEGRDRAFT_66764 [Naegleria gruberi]EFC45103.1 predicted protein [Naegleria gruberi]|eukprot:XP_002677847.1 predicted protein [Naegleria gruberi strain NEG-M]